MGLRVILGAALALLAIAPPVCAESISATPSPAIENPSSVPGFFDPSTNTFEPLVDEPQAAAGTTTGRIDTFVHIDLGDHFADDATVTCEMTLFFGPPFNQGPLTEVDSFDEEDNERDPSLRIHYAFTPTVGNPQAKVTVKCSARDKRNNVRSIAFDLPPVPVDRQSISTADVYIDM